MIPIPGTWIVAGVAALAVTGYVGHCEYVKRDRATFIAKLETEAAAQKKAAALEDLRRLQNKERADEEYKRRIDGLNAAVKRLRERADTVFVPAAPAGARRPELACFDRAELERAIRVLDTSLQGIAAEGSAATLGLDAAKDWASRQ